MRLLLFLSLLCENSFDSTPFTSIKEPETLTTSPILASKISHQTRPPPSPKGACPPPSFPRRPLEGAPNTPRELLALASRPTSQP
ncbi:hypothetical protein JTE90_007299 [Oedothorax gibbosus]|uniref:Uncharacterized protein n=1 Tax=Oedothorax gibbosus TaxID=931172 RepID=A0AAV6UDJ8_9ARAC|nr:hypothetical protein JTE90_007299 [Oedothorax gibbosus]